MRKIIQGLIAGGLIVSGNAFAAIADDIKHLLDQNRFVDAYDIGRNSPDSYGDPAFDFFFGIAAIDAGHAGEGILALERYLLNFPDNRSARFHLARGYFSIGEDLRARDEFEHLLPSAEGNEKLAIEGFMQAIRSRESRYRPTASAFLEIGIGFDSNINGGLNSGATPSIPGIGNLPPLPGNSISAKEGGSFSYMAGGAQGAYPVSPGLALTGSVGFSGRLHHGDDNDIFDGVNFGAAGGASILSGNNLYKIGIGLGQLAQDNQRYVFTSSAFAEWNHQLDQFNRFDLSGQLARLSYDDMKVYPLKDKSVAMIDSRNSVRTADFIGLAGGWTRVFTGNYRPVLRISATYGEETNQRDRPDLSRDLWGVRGSVSLTPMPRWGTSLALGYQDSRHKDRFTVGSSSSRKDATWTFDAGIAYQYDANLTLRADYTRTEQRSNIELYQYDRDQLIFKVRYDFK